MRKVVKQKSTKQQRTKQLNIIINNKVETRLKKIMKQLDIKSKSEAVRHCIENF